MQLGFGVWALVWFIGFGMGHVLSLCDNDGYMIPVVYYGLDYYFVYRYSMSLGKSRRPISSLPRIRVSQCDLYTTSSKIPSYMAISLGSRVLQVLVSHNLPLVEFDNPHFQSKSTHGPPTPMSIKECHLLHSADRASRRVPTPSQMHITSSPFSPQTRK
jgi:hypothetical protein